MKTRIQMLDVTYFLIDKFNYQRMNVINPDLDLWLVNKDNTKHPIIRLTSVSLSKGLAQKDDITKQTAHLSELMKSADKILNIHFIDEKIDILNNGNYSQAIVSESFISQFLKTDFPGLNACLKPISENLQFDLKRRELKILDLANKPKVKMKFSLKMIGPTQVLIALNLIVFMFATFLQASYGGTLAAVMMGGLYKNFIYGANEWWRLISAGFLHVDLFHILINMMVLVQAGALVERVYGRKQMVIIYMTSVITSSLLALIMMDGGTISLGASGGIFGLVGAIIVYLFSSNLVKVPQIRNQIFRTLILNILISLIPGISFYGHLGGFIGGVLISVAIADAKMLKPAKIHAYISTALIVVGMFIFSVGFDKNVYNIKPDVDKFSIMALNELGFNTYAQRLNDKMIIYYKSLGETYE